MSMCAGRILMGKIKNPAHWPTISQRKRAGLLSQSENGGAKGTEDLQNNSKMPDLLENGEQAISERRKEDYW